MSFAGFLPIAFVVFHAAPLELGWSTVGRFYKHGAPPELCLAWSQFQAAHRSAQAVDSELDTPDRPSY
jgi:hypothetical protein